MGDMTTQTEPWQAGTPCWADVSTPDVAAAQAFYSSVLGWEFPDAPSEEFGGYVVGKIGGHDAGGIGPIQPGNRPAWTLYLASDDVDASLKAVEANGGGVLLPAMDIGGSGRMAIVADPTGGVFGLWQGQAMVGSEHVNAAGGLSWEDLRSTNPDIARTFYRALFDYIYVSLPEAGPDYTMITFDGERPLGGLGGMMGSPEGTPSHWLVYYGVASVDSAIGAAVDGGGSLIVPAFDTPYGRMAGVADIAGAIFMLVEMQADAES
jgi:predicted enzyme related to lactoylglutathione lyase